MPGLKFISMEKTNKIILFLLLIFTLPFTIYAQEEGNGHGEEEGKSIVLQEGLPEKQEIPATENSIFASLSEFPNLHPMVVHFPIVLLLLAFFTQLIGLFIFRLQMSWVTLFLLMGGFVGALLAALVFHAHVKDLPEPIKKVFENHEFYAYLTLWLSGIALALKVLSHFMVRKLWMEVIVLLLLTGSAITVSFAGHLGSQMVYIEEVGPGGNYIEHHHDE